MERHFHLEEEDDDEDDEARQQFQYLQPQIHQSDPRQQDPQGHLRQQETREYLRQRAHRQDQKALLERERETVLSILACLIEIDRRRLYLPRGYSSLFEFCVKHLGYSESTAGRRISIARCIRDFPRVYRLLASGRINLTNVAKITGIITPQNAERLLASIEGRSNREVEIIVSRHRPKSSIRDRVKPVYVMTELRVQVDDTRVRTSGEAAGQAGGDPETGEKSTPSAGSGKFPNSGDDGESAAGSKASPDSGKGTVKPAAERRMVLEQRFKVEFGVDPEFLEKLERVRSLLSTKHHAKLEFEELFSVLMDEYIERHSPEGRIRRKAGRNREKKRSKGGQALHDKGQKPQKRQQRSNESQQDKPKPRQKSERSRYIPASVRGEVYARDRGRCTFVAPGGKRCGSTWDLQIDHIVPFARGGDNSPGNLRLLCARHNRLEAKRAFGEKHMEQFCDP